MRRTASVTSVSWIPSEAVAGPMRLGFTLGVGHYDDPPEPVLGDLLAWRDADRFRFANHLAAVIEVDDDGRVTAARYTGGGLIGSTTLRLGRSVTFAAVRYPDLQPAPEIGDGWARFRQTVGGRTGVPMPRTVRRPPYAQLTAPTVWTTLELTVHADGRSEAAMTGASPFPRHWVYDGSGALTAKSGLADYTAWSRECFGDASPWGDADSPALVTAVETALERTLSTTIMRGDARPRIATLAAGEALVRQGETGRELFLLLDGVVQVVVDGAVVAELGPGAVGGERALVEDGARTATLVALTRARIAVVPGDQVDPAALRELAEGHRREELVSPRPTA
jgi:YD repeat-containing protein